MVNTWVTVGRRRSFEEDELGITLSFIDTFVEDVFVEDVFLLPRFQDFLVGTYKVQSLVLGEFLCHIISVILLVF